MSRLPIDRRLPIRGINYDTGINFTPPELSRTHWHPASVEHDMQVIARELHCTAVAVIGTDLDRLRQAAQYVLAEGMDVWIQPRLVEGSSEAVLEHLGQAAELAEELRRQYPNKVALNVGCELSLFMKGILPGNTFMSRMTALMILWPFMAFFNGKLNKHLAAACAVARQHFEGPLVYSSGDWESVDWLPFDYVGVDYYKQSSNASTYTAGLRAYQQHNKPVIVTEFGCCTFKGAERRGGGGFLIVNWKATPPTVKPGYVRDEQVQVRYITELAELYKEEKVHGAFVYSFSEPDNLYTADARTDLDMASYGIVKITRRATESQPEQWERKAAFETVAAMYANS